MFFFLCTHATSSFSCISYKFTQSFLSVSFHFWGLFRGILLCSVHHYIVLKRRKNVSESESKMFKKCMKINKFNSAEFYTQFIYKQKNP